MQSERAAQMTPNDATSAASLTVSTLTAIGIPAHAASIVGSIVGVAMLLVFLASQAMPWLPVPTAASPGWYRVPYGLLARATGSWRNNAPMPSSPQPSGIVPVPPSMKKD
jgi:hypothetical protein